MNANSSKNQRIKSKFVDREVIYCVSPLIYSLAHIAQYLKADDYEDFQRILSRSDYESAIENNPDYQVQYSEKFGGYVWINKDIHVISRPFDTKPEAYADCVSKNDLNYDSDDALEHWIVSKWLAKKLEAHGEIVGEFMGLTIWGRCSAGQAILLDGVISDICSELEILDGQKNEWEV